MKIKNLITVICLDCSSLFNNLLLLLKKHLITFYKSITIFKFLLFKNRYMIFPLITLALVTFIFNNNLDYFNDFTIGNLNNINLFNIKSIIFLFITIYLAYIKLNFLIRTIALIKGFSFFYREIKTNLIKDIKFMCLYFYIFNLFFVSISILFIINLINNIFTINSDLGMLINYSTNITSLLILCFYFYEIINHKFNINTSPEGEINPLKILFLIGIVFTPLIVFNLYADEINNLLGNNIFKFSSFAFTDSTKDFNYNE